MEVGQIRENLSSSPMFPLCSVVFTNMQVADLTWRSQKSLKKKKRKKERKRLLLGKL
jgi:hypothetical protein